MWWNLGKSTFRSFETLLWWLWRSKFVFAFMCRSPTYSFSGRETWNCRHCSRPLGWKQTRTRGERAISSAGGVRGRTSQRVSASLGMCFLTWDLMIGETRKTGKSWRWYLCMAHFRTRRVNYTYWKFKKTLAFLLRSFSPVICLYK